MTDYLYHISDEPGIVRFDPREPSRPVDGRQDPIVWAIDEVHLPNYLLPRDCPRVTFRVGEATTCDDVARVIGPSGSQHVIAIESAWWPRVRQCRLYQYCFDPAAFGLTDVCAGYHVCRDVVEPISEKQIDDVVGALLGYEVELRIMPSLWDLREVVINSTLEFSIIRMRNAQPPAGGAERFHPLP